jgi:hypothetical protein
MPYIWTEPAEILTHKDVTVYHVYKDDFWDRGVYQFFYRTGVTEEESSFDIRDLECYQEGAEHTDILKLAIESGEITAPAN